MTTLEYGGKREEEGIRGWGGQERGKQVKNKGISKVF